MALQLHAVQQTFRDRHYNAANLVSVFQEGGKQGMSPAQMTSAALPSASKARPVATIMTTITGVTKESLNWGIPEKEC